MIILGIDPGTATTGYGLISLADTNGSRCNRETIIKNNPKRISLVEFGVIKTAAGEEMPKRLLKIRKELKKLIKEFEPKIVVIERLFFNTNAKTAMTVGQARGVVMLVAAETRLPVLEYTALEAKKELTGYGRADKKDVEKAVKRCLRIRRKIRPDDAADALAVAICHVKKCPKD